jgi:hypothetical protein
MAERCHASGWPSGETYVLGDSPLVLLTALRANWFHAPTSCRWVTRPGPAGRAVRVFTQLDNRLLLEDLYAKLALHAAEVDPVVNR